jgi:hypothetical protein
MININCIVKEKRNYNITDTDLAEYMDCFYNTNENVQIDNDQVLSIKLEYDENYPLKELKQIANYYSLSTRLKKQELINKIVEYETTFENNDIVLQRKHSWYCLEQLKQDRKMQKYVLFL